MSVNDKLQIQRFISFDYVYIAQIILKIIIGTFVFIMLSFKIFRVSKGLEPDQDQHFVGPDLDS